MIWNEPPTRDEVKECILDFFDRLPENPEGALALLRVEPQADRTPQQSFDAILRGLWEDLEDWWEDLDDPSLDGPWRQQLTPLRAVTTDTLGWSFSGDADPLEEGETVLVNVHCFGDPTDDTAQFSLRAAEGGYALYLDMIHVM
jgi:hypothetical protein